MDALGLADAPAEERVKALLEMPGQELISKLPPSVLTAPAIDDDLVRSGVTYEELGKLDSEVLPGIKWCQELLIGDAEIDVCPVLQCGEPWLMHPHSQAYLSTWHLR